MSMLVCKNVCIKVTPPFSEVLEAEAQFIVMPEEFGVLRNFRQEDLSHLQRTLCDNVQVHIHKQTNILEENHLI